MAQHTVAAFDAELKELRAAVQSMAATVDVQLAHLADAIEGRDGETAQTIISMDRVVDRMQGEIEEKIVQLIARRQPVAVDLRELIATLKIVSDIERIGDMAKNCGKRLLAMSQQGQRPDSIGTLLALSKQARGQVVNVMKAFVARDAEAAMDVWRSDSLIDNLYTGLFRELLTYMMEDPRNIGFCTHLLFCAKNLERIGDHATNIAENVNFIVTGEQVKLERPKGDSPTQSILAATSGAGGLKP